MWSPQIGCMMIDVCILGAGLSGAYTANSLLTKGISVTVIDARDRIGGRLLTATRQGGGDLGGAWIWPRSEPSMHFAMEEHCIKTVNMRLEGESFALTGNGVHHVLPSGTAGQYAACGTGAVRVSGGASTLVEKLLAPKDKLSLELNMRVTQIKYKEDGAEVSYESTASDSNDRLQKTIPCRAVVLAAPPKILAKTIEFDPPLPKVKNESMLATPTWMEDFGKVAISFEKNWWRASGKSGISIDQQGAVQTWWEACSGLDGDGTKPTLAGFVTGNGAKTLSNILTAKGEAALHEYVLESIMRVYGLKTKKELQNDSESSNTCRNEEERGSIEKGGLAITTQGITVTYKSWKADPYTNTATKSEYLYETAYGDSSLQQSVGSLFFAGTETARGHGHMEGAIQAAQRVAAEVESFLELT